MAAVAGVVLITLSGVAADIRWLSSLSMTVGVLLVLQPVFWTQSPEEGKAAPSVGRKIVAAVVCVVSITLAVVAYLPSVSKSLKVILLISYFAVLTAVFVFLEIRRRAGD